MASIVGSLCNSFTKPGRTASDYMKSTLRLVQDKNNLHLLNHTELESNFCEGVDIVPIQVEYKLKRGKLKQIFWRILSFLIDIYEMLKPAQSSLCNNAPLSHQPSQSGNCQIGLGLNNQAKPNEEFVLNAAPYPSANRHPPVSPHQRQSSSFCIYMSFPYLNTTESRSTFVFCSVKTLLLR